MTVTLNIGGGAEGGLKFKTLKPQYTNSLDT